MPSYYIDYAKLTPQEAHRAAIADIKAYVGEEYYTKVMALLRAKYAALTFDQFCYVLYLFPVSGRPLRAMWDEAFPLG